MNFLSDNMVYRRGQDYLRRRRSRNRGVTDEQQVNQAGGDTKVDDSEGDTPSRHCPPTSNHRPRRTSLSLPVAEAGESADDEDEPAPAGDAVAWKHTDRALNARLSRQEQLEREKAVIDDALRTSLSTLMMLQPGASASTPPRYTEQPLESSRSPPSLSTSPSSTLTLRSGRAREATSVGTPQQRTSTSAFGGRAASQSMYSTSPVRQRPTNLMERRRTYTSATTSSNRPSGVNASLRAAQRQEEPDWTDASANISSASSYEDLGKGSSPQEGSDLDMDFLSSAGDEEGLPTNQTSARARTSKDAGTSSPRRRRRLKRDRTNSLRRTAVAGRTNQGGIQSDPEGRSTKDRTADDSFLDLLEATKTFMAMNPRYTSTPNSSAFGGGYFDSSAAQSMPARLPRSDRTPRSRTVDLPEEATYDQQSRRSDEHSPAPPASMSASTNFDLSSSDSPPSHGLTSSRGGDDASKDEYDVDIQTPPPPPIVSDPRLSFDGSRDLAAPRDSDEAEKPAARPPAETWLDWLNRQFRRVTVGIGLVGLGLVLAVGVGLFKTPTIRRR